MLNKNNVIFYDDEDKEYIVGTVCGVNIKAISEKDKIVKIGKSVKLPGKVIAWGLFLHVRMDNGDQYDLVWKLERSVSTNDSSMPCNYKKYKSHDYPIIPIIPTIFKACNVKEWVELIGSKISLERFGKIIPSTRIHGGMVPDNNYHQHGFCIYLRDNHNYDLTDSIIKPDFYTVFPGKFA